MAAGDASTGRSGPAPDRYRNALGKYKVDRSADCESCGECVEAVPVRACTSSPTGYAFTLRPQDHLCIGPECAETDHYCIAQCPQEGAVAARAIPTRRRAWAIRAGPAI